MSDALLPLFLKLEGRKVLLVGGGNVASHKLSALLDAGAIVTVVAPSIHESMRQPGVHLVARRFQPSDLDGAWLAVAAAPPEVNGEVTRAAEERRVFVNAVDDVSSATAYAGGCVRRGDVCVAISTSGRAPALAGLLREGIDALLPSELESWVETAAFARGAWKSSGVPLAERRPLLLRALNALYGERVQEISP